jgi:hypothetical protein
MTDTEQATELLRKIGAAQRAFDRLDGFDKLITESEVRLRYDAIVGSLLVFESDVRSMRDQWKAEDIAEAAAAELAEAPQTSPNKPMVSASQIAADTKDFPF